MPQTAPPDAHCPLYLHFQSNFKMMTSTYLLKLDAVM